jgi:hypothetical protein
MNDFNSTDAADVITATLVPDDERLDFLPKLFGVRLMLQGEHMVYGWMRALSPDYVGGYWDFYRLSNGGGYMAPKLVGPVQIEVEGNGFSGSMSADAAGIVATLFALCNLAAQVREDAVIDLFHGLRGFAAEHAEASLIYSAID